MRTIGWRAKPSARAQPPERAEADGRRALAVGQRGAQHAALDEVGAHGGDALVVPAERAQAAGERRVGRDVSARSRSAASRGRRARPSSCPRRRPRRAGCGRARARGRSTRGPAARPARRAARSCAALAGTAARSAARPPPRRRAARGAARSRPRTCSQPAAALSRRRGRSGRSAPAARCRRPRRRRCPRRTATRSCVHAAPSVEANALRSRHARQRGDRAHDALVAAQRRLGGEQQLELVLQRDGERVELAGRGPVPARRRDRRQRPSPAARAGPRRSRARGPARPRRRRGVTSRVAAKPQPPPTRTRTPMPSDVGCRCRRPGRCGRRSPRSRDVDVARLGVGAAPSAPPIRSVRRSSISRPPRRGRGSPARSAAGGVPSRSRPRFTPRRRSVSSASSVTPRSRSRWAPRARASRRASASIARRPRRRARQRLGRAPAQGDGRVGQHRRVGVAVPHAGEAHQRLGEHVVQAVAGRSRSRSRTAARRARARRGRPRWREQARRLARGERRHGRARGVSGPSTAWPSELAAAAASSAAGWEAHRRRVVDHDRRAHARRGGRRRAAWRWPRVISAAHSVVGIAAAPAPRARPPAPWPRRSPGRRRAPTSRSPSTASQQVARDLVDAPGRHVVHGRGACDDGRAPRRGARRGRAAS